MRISEINLSNSVCMDYSNSSYREAKSCVCLSYDGVAILWVSYLDISTEGELPCDWLIMRGFEWEYDDDDEEYESDEECHIVFMQTDKRLEQLCFA